MSKQNELGDIMSTNQQTDSIIMTMIKVISIALVLMLVVLIAYYLNQTVFAEEYGAIIVFPLEDNKPERSLEQIKADLKAQVNQTMTMLEQDRLESEPFDIASVIPMVKSQQDTNWLEQRLQSDHR